ncbi:MAG: hypothetical protein KatS3mg028_0588 [Bacteroidia bacterium]|nr:MAG: hypothetical protein KatS3mg028_0588 [Bacteroidia bacterium]
MNMTGFTNIPIHQNIYGADELMSKIDNGFFLVLTDTEKVPPHCSVLCQQRWYSLNYAECKVKMNAEILLKTLFSKNKPAVFMELDIYPELKDVEKIFSKYTAIDFEKQITCISPIKEILNACGIPVHSNALLYEMIDVLKNMDRIRKVYFFNSDEKVYILPHYSVNDLQTIKP